MIRAIRNICQVSTRLFSKTLKQREMCYCVCAQNREGVRCNPQLQTVCIITFKLRLPFTTKKLPHFLYIVVLISPQPDLLPDLFCLMVRIFRLMLVLLYINSTNIPPIVIINNIYENQNLLSLLLVSFQVGLRTYQHLCI